MLGMGLVAAVGDLRDADTAEILDIGPLYAAGTPPAQLKLTLKGLRALRGLGSSHQWAVAVAHQIEVASTEAHAVTALRRAAAAATDVGAVPPDARRLITAAVVASLATRGGREVVAAAQSTLEALARCHVARLKALARPPLGAPVYLLHVSKAGGTSLCRLSRYNRCLEDATANNCWLRGMGPVWFAGFEHQERSCADYATLLREGLKPQQGLGGLDILANEGYLDGGAGGRQVTTTCPSMLYITLLRHPKTRVFSHMNQPGVRLSGQPKGAYYNKSVEERIRLRPEIANDYMVRMLLGRDAFEKPLGALGQADLHSAARVLAQFDMVLLLESKVPATGARRRPHPRPLTPCAPEHGASSTRRAAPVAEHHRPRLPQGPLSPSRGTIAVARRRGAHLRGEPPRRSSLRLRAHNGHARLAHCDRGPSPACSKFAATDLRKLEPQFPQTVVVMRLVPILATVAMLAADESCTSNTAANGGWAASPTEHAWCDDGPSRAPTAVHGV